MWGNRTTGRRIRATLVLGLLLAACADADASTTRVLPLPKVTPTQGETQRAGHTVLFIPSLLVTDVHGKLTLDCYGCERFRNSPNVVVWTQLTSTSNWFSQVNWFLRSGRGMIIKVVGTRKNKNAVGRYRRLRVERRDGVLQLVTSRTGCLNSKGRRRRCPSRVKSPKPGTAIPSTPIQPPHAPASNQVTIDTPPNNSVQRCHNFTGTADLAPGSTLVLAVRNLNHTDPIWYFETVANWSGGVVGKWPWQGLQFFGSGDSSVGQTMELRVLVMSHAAIAREAAAHGAPPGWTAWNDRAVPPDAVFAKTLLLDRVPGAGACA